MFKKRALKRHSICAPHLPVQLYRDTNNKLGSLCCFLFRDMLMIRKCHINFLINVRGYKAFRKPLYHSQC